MGDFNIFSYKRIFRVVISKIFIYFEVELVLVVY